MENALLIGLSRQMSLRREMEVVSNNVANINTTGFKGDTAIFEEYLMPGASADQFARPDRKLSYVVDRSTWHDMSQGAMQQTGNPLDVAIDGNAFMVVQTPRGERYTRNGALQINSTGQLVTSEGFRVLGDGGPIQFQTTDKEILIARDGQISTPEGTRGKLRLVKFDGAVQRLTKDGGSTFAAPQGVQPIQVTPEERHVLQGSLERSNVRSVIEMTRMIEVTRAYSSVATMLQNQGEMRKSAVEKLAEVPA
jgi:flagellar basal-body rod protein FlgF